MKKSIKLEEGKTYSICACGASLRLPFCDGRHRSINNGRGYKSVKIKAEKTTHIEISCSNWVGLEKSG